MSESRCAGCGGLLPGSDPRPDSAMTRTVSARLAKLVSGRWWAGDFELCVRCRFDRLAELMAYVQAALLTRLRTLLRCSAANASGAGGGPGGLALPFDDRAGQCARAADYIEAHPGCTLAELGERADLESATKVTTR